MKKTKTINIEIGDRGFEAIPYVCGDGIGFKTKQYFKITTNDKKFNKDYNKGIKDVKLTYEIDELILDETEKKYLSVVIKPFRNKIEHIRKVDNGYCGCYIDIIMKDDDNLVFPYFKDKRMYKDMVSFKEYTLEELGL